MKFKTYLSLLLVFVIAVCPVTGAFAVESDFELNGTNYVYYGELSEGRTNVCEDVWMIENVYAYYSFNVSSEGYYRFCYGTPHTDMWAGVSEIDNDGTEPDYEETLYDYYLTNKIYYLTEGEYNLVIDIYSSGVDVDITYEFLGEKITDISFNYDQLLDYDLDWWGSKGNYTFDSYADATITFSSGKIYEFSDGVLEGTVNSEPVNGKNDVIVDFLNQKIASTVTVYPVSYFVSDAELSNVEYYLENAVEYYNRLEKEYPYGETITVTFSDGTTQVLEYSTYQPYITLPNGQEYKVEIYYNTKYDLFTPNEYTLQICLGYNCVMKEYEVVGPKASFIDNVKLITKDNKVYSDKMFKNIGPMLRSIGNEEESMYYFEKVITAFMEIYVNCYDFFHYYATFSFI